MSVSGETIPEGLFRGLRQLQRAQIARASRKAALGVREIPEMPFYKKLMQPLESLR